MFCIFQINDDKVERTLASQSLTTGLQDLPKVHNMVLENVEKVREKVRKRKTRQGQEDRFEVGDKVLRKNIREEQRKGGKMGSAMLGPFTISNIEGKGVDLVSEKGKAILKVNVDHLSRYIEAEPRLPHKWPTMATMVIPVQCPPTCTVECLQSPPAKSLQSPPAKSLQSPPAESLQSPPACTVQCKRTAAGTSQQHSYVSGIYAM